MNIAQTDGFFKQGKTYSSKNRRGNTPLITFQIEDENALLYHYEPIYRNEQKVGHMTSGQYSPLLKKSIGLGYIHNHDGIVDKEYVMNAEYKINILNEDFKATPSLSPLYDPKMEKVKA